MRKQLFQWWILKDKHGELLKEEKLMCRVIAVSNQKGGVGKTVAIRISRIRKPIFHVRTDTEKSRS